MRSLLGLALLLAACAPEAPPPDPSLQPETASPEAQATAPADTADFDAQAWLQDHAAAFESSGDYDTNVQRGRAALADLPPDVERACFTFPDQGYQPPDELPHAFGLLWLERFGTGEALVTATCYVGAYQGSFILIHLQGPDAALVETPVWNTETERLTLSDIPVGLTDYEDLENRTFTVFAKSRGLGDCGVWTRYRLGESLGEIEALEVRERDCDYDPSEELPPPNTWPVVWPAS